MKQSAETSVGSKVDEDLFQSFQEITNSLKEFYSYLRIASSRKQEIIESWNEGQSPSLAAELSPSEVGGFEQALLDLEAMKLDLPDDEDPVHILYRWKLDETIAQIKLVLASTHGDMATFHKQNHDIYGAPDEILYRAALDWVCNDAEVLRATQSSTEEQKAAAQKVVDRLTPMRGYRELLSPESVVFEKIRQDHYKENGYFALLLDGITQPGDTITEEQGDVIIEHVLRKNISTDYEYEKRKGGSWGVSHSMKKVYGPESYSYSWRRFVGLPLGHETGTHLTETKNALGGPLLLASIGLDHFERGTEGRAVVREQVPYDSFDEFGKLVRWRDILRRHIAISYAEGVGEESRVSHHEVYEFMEQIDHMYALKDGFLADEAADAARTRTNALLLRVLKGTTGEGAYLKDKVYLEGNVAAWLAASMRGASAISEADKAKYDINNSRHLLQLIKLGVINHDA